MKEIAIVIMAAGLGSRFKGGIKQLEPIGPNNKTIMEYSIDDAIKAGFNKVIFIIRKDIENDFKKLIGNKYKNKIKCEYVYQDINNIPGNFKKGERIKPWGTGHAILSAKDKIKGPFLVINADDYYGKESYIKIYNFLSSIDEKSYNFCMAGFILKNTLSNNGGVNRGICKINNNYLISIKETHNIKKNGLIANSDEGQLPLDSIVSMNMWGFTPKILEELELEFNEFLVNLDSNDLTSEFLLPNIVNNLLNKKATVKILNTNETWYGITYLEDVEYIKNAFIELHKKGIYK